jgi:uncharacterized protein YbjT (DUF2867 family)
VREPILVTGGTGTLGSAVVRRLLDAGLTPRTTSRRPGPGDWSASDLRTGDGLAEALAGAEVVIHCVDDIRGGQGGSVLTRNLVAAAERAEVPPHLVYISIVGVDRIPLGCYRSKLADERLIEKSGLPHTILRATQFHDLVRTVLAASAVLPVMFVPSARFQPIDVGDVAVRLIELASAPPAGRAADLGGPEVRDIRELAGSWKQASGKRRPVVPVRLPGKIFGALRRGANLVPGNAAGTVTFDAYLAERTALRKKARGSS